MAEKNDGTASPAPLPPNAQAAAVRELLRDNPSLTLNMIASQHPELAAGVEKVRAASATQRRTPVGSGSGPMDRKPITDL